MVKAGNVYVYKHRLSLLIHESSHQDRKGFAEHFYSVADRAKLLCTTLTVIMAAASTVGARC